MNSIDAILAGDTAAAAQLISKIEDNPDSEFKEINILREKIIDTRILGITGPAGVGKSTLLARFIENYRRRNFKIAILAVDPTSPFSGGALLGDRIRMQSHSTDPGVFIRSMATRNHCGGVARTTSDAARIMAAWGADIVIIETVGVGQGEIEIMNIAGTIIVVLSPVSGDDIQMMKAGIMEIGDIFIINKSDIGNSAHTKKALIASNPGRKSDNNWIPVILETVATKNIGIDDVIKSVDQHMKQRRKNA